MVLLLLCFDDQHQKGVLHANPNYILIIQLHRAEGTQSLHDMDWWQYQLLDCYGSCLTLLAVHVNVEEALLEVRDPSGF